MAGDKQGAEEVRAAASAEARKLRTTLAKAALGTVCSGAGGPFVTLVLVAFDETAAPLFLISKLARHTRNLDADPRASLLLDGTDGAGDPTAGARLTLVGHIAPVVDPSAKAAFLARHPTAAGYADFGDFGMYRMRVDTGHLVAGFGRIVELCAADWSGA